MNREPGFRLRRQRPAREDNRWASHRFLAFALRTTVRLAPVAVAILVSLAGLRLLPGSFIDHLWPGRVCLVVVSILASLAAERVTRRAMPLAVLLQLTLLFPDRAPSRLKVARGGRRRPNPAEPGAVSEPTATAERVLGLLTSLTAHDRRTRGHCERVRVYADMLGSQLKLPAADLDRLRWAALLHDIGKLEIDPEILNKPAKPSEQEWAILRAHPQQGARLAAPLLAWLGEWGTAIEQHHERYDGAGYPHGLAGTDISRAGRLLAIVDAYEVMTAARPYKRAVSARAARAELARDAGSHFDPVLVRAFLEISLPRLLWTTGPFAFAGQLPLLRGLGQLAQQLPASGAVAVTAAGSLVAASLGSPAPAAVAAGRHTTAHVLHAPLVDSPLHPAVRKLTTPTILLTATLLAATTTLAQTPFLPATSQWIAATPTSPQSPLPLFRKSFIARQTHLPRDAPHLRPRPVRSPPQRPQHHHRRPHPRLDRLPQAHLLQHLQRHRAPPSRPQHPSGVLLGNGFYNAQEIPGRYGKFTGTFGQPKLIAALRLTFTDGTLQTISSDATWQTAPGPITLSSVYGGEDFDARLEPSGWDTPAFNAATWLHTLSPSAGPGGALQPRDPSHPSSPSRLHTPSSHHPPPTRPHRLRPRPELRRLARAHRHRPARRNPQAPPRRAPRCRRPRHPAQRQRLPRTPRSPSTTPCAVPPPLIPSAGTHASPTTASATSRSSRPAPSSQPPASPAAPSTSPPPQTGTFTSSDDLLNRIHSLIDRAVDSNLFSVLTDCPHREKLGWLEQTHLAADVLMYNHDLQSLYAKISDDMLDAQLPNGLVPSIAPEYPVFEGAFRDSPEWGSAVILSPWAAFQFYGDLATLRSHYASMQRYAAYLQSRIDQDPNHLLTYGLGDWYDIGPGEPGESKLTTKGLTATATYYEDLTTLAHIATLLHHPDDATTYTAQAATAKQTFNARFFHADTNQYDTGSQTANAMPLVTGLVPEDRRTAVLANLVTDIHAHHDHVTAGDIGFHYVVRALTDGDRSDVLLAMLSRTDAPSYGAQLAHGATTLTEAWDANPNSSQDHFMLGPRRRVVLSRPRRHRHRPQPPHPRPHPHPPRRPPLHSSPPRPRSIPG